MDTELQEVVPGSLISTEGTYFLEGNGAHVAYVNHSGSNFVCTSLVVIKCIILSGSDATSSHQLGCFSKHVVLPSGQKTRTVFSDLAN